MKKSSFILLVFGVLLALGCQQAGGWGDPESVPFLNMFNLDIPADGLTEVRNTIMDAERAGLGKDYPIILVPGFLGTDEYDVFGICQFDYWNNVAEMFEAAGFPEVHLANIDATNYSTDGPLTQYGCFLNDPEQDPERWEGIVDEIDVPVRGRSSQLNDEVAEILKNYPPGTRINLVGHSQGALTCRWFISNFPLGERVNALVTLSGANMGVDGTRLAFEKDLENEVEHRVNDLAIPQELANLVTGFLGHFMQIFTHSEDVYCKGALTEMYPPYTREIFMKYCPDRPGVKYFSIASRLVELDRYASPFAISPVWGPHILYNIMDWGPNDGIIAVKSMRGPTVTPDSDEIDPNWIYMGEMIGKPISVIDKITLGKVRAYVGLDHIFYLNLPMGAIKSIIDLQLFYRDIGRLFRAYSQ